MELLLNLAWMLLALPAFWLWRQGESSRALRRVTSLQCLLALGCVLVLLFPVISASDDLHVMRAEIEESATSKRTVRQLAGDKISAWTSRLQSPPGLAVNAAGLPDLAVALLEVWSPKVPFLTQARHGYAGRAPPFSFLG
jgi:hypothetical protein